MRRAAQSGISLIEVMVAVAIIGVLFALGMPAYSTWIQNTQIRTAAEAVLNGLQTAKNEAIQRNVTVQFQLPNAANTHVAGEPREQPGRTRRFASRLAEEGSPNATIAFTPADANTVTFSSLGRVVPNADASPSITQVDIDNPTIPVVGRPPQPAHHHPGRGRHSPLRPDPKVGRRRSEERASGAPTMTPNPSGQQGVILLEALIGILIFSLGVLALVAMQAVSVSNVSNARYRTEAAFLANEIISEIWVDRGAATRTWRATPSRTAAPRAFPPQTWVQKVRAQLPGSDVNGPTWSSPRRPRAAAR